MQTVVVTPRSVSRDGHPALQAIEQAGYRLVFPSPGKQPSEEELIKAMPGCVGYLAGVEPVTRRVLEAADSLRVISRNGVGLDNLDLEAAEERGIAVEPAFGANLRSVAELAIGHMLCAARSIAAADSTLKKGGWERTKGIELNGRTLGIVGFGSIGRIVAELGGCFGMRVLVHDPYLAADAELDERVARVELATLIAEADVLSLHCPPLQGAYLIGEAEIARMKPGAIIVNTARDGLVDSAAAASALRSGHLRAVTVDAFAQEPPADFSFVQTAGVIATPHVGGFTAESVDRAIELAVENLLRVLQRAAS